MAAKNLRQRLVAAGCLMSALFVAWAFVAGPASHLIARETPAAPHSRDKHPEQHRVPIIDGALRPDLISDDQALSMFLVMAAHPENRAGRAYVHYILNGAGGVRRLDQDALEAIRAAAVEYYARLNALYRSVQGDVTGPKSALVEEYRARIIAVLGDGGAERLSTTLNRRVKTKLRTFDRPQN